MRLLGAVKAQQCPQGHLAPGMSAKAPFCGKSCLLAGQESAWAYKNWKSAWEALKSTKTSSKEWHPLGFVSPMVRAGGGPALRDILTRWSCSTVPVFFPIFILILLCRSPGGDGGTTGSNDLLQ